MISVIIPVYNVEKYIKQCLESILIQTYQDFEIICVDDGSTDNSLEILKQYAQKDSRFKILTRENGGAGLARNAGLEIASGKYIQFIDSDDWIEKNMFETMVQTAESNNADIVVCSSRKVDDFGNITETKNPNFPINLDKAPINKPFNYNEYSDDFFSICGVIVWNKLYSRNLIEKNHLRFHKLIGPEDICFTCMAEVCANTIVVLNDEFINYRFNRPQSVQTYRSNHAIDIIKAGLFVKDFLEEKNLYKELEKSFIESFTAGIRWELINCSSAQYSKFIEDLKKVNGWEIFKHTLVEQKNVTINDLYKLAGDKTVMLWGASYYIKELLSNETVPHSNILGIIDRNTASWGKKAGNYKIFPPSAINEFKPEGIILTVYNNNEVIYPQLKKELSINYPQTKLLPNLFE